MKHELTQEEILVEIKDILSEYIKLAGPFAPATSTFIHRTTAHFISLICYSRPYKNRSS